MLHHLKHRVDVIFNEIWMSLLPIRLGTVLGPLNIHRGKKCPLLSAAALNSPGFRAHQVIYAFLTLRLNYCDFLYQENHRPWKKPSSQFRMQRLPCLATQVHQEYVILNSDRLHWLSIEQRIQSESPQPES